MQQADTVTFFSKPGCGGCIATERAFKAKKITYDYVDITSDDGLKRIKALGYAGAPVIETSRDHWQGFNLEKINEIQ